MINSHIKPYSEGENPELMEQSSSSVTWFIDTRESRNSQTLKHFVEAEIKKYVPVQPHYWLSLHCRYMKTPHTETRIRVPPSHGIEDLDTTDHGSYTIYTFYAWCKGSEEDF